MRRWRIAAAKIIVVPGSNGSTVLLPRSYLTPVDRGMEEAMRFLITAGLSRTPEPDGGNGNHHRSAAEPPPAK